MKLVWHATHLDEREWLRDLLGPVIDAELEDPQFSNFDSDTIHVIDCNVTPLVKCEPYFAELRARANNIVLVHLSDEYFAGGYAAYRHFDCIIRNFYAWFVRGPGIYTIPLGYPNGTPIARFGKPADQRTLTWSFSGQLKASRYEAIEAFDTLEPHFCEVHSLRTSPGAPPPPIRPQHDIFNESIFVLCPMGNVSVATPRVFKALEYGCIPVLETRTLVDYHRNELGEHPLPAFHTWSAARQYCQSLLADPERLRTTQREVFDWWQTKKQAVQRQLVTEALGEPHSADLVRFADRPQSRSRLVELVLSLAELVRHQSPRSFLRRIVKPVGPTRRILSSLR
jgi:hypothetical protein